MPVPSPVLEHLAPGRVFRACQSQVTAQVCVSRTQELHLDRDQRFQDLGQEEPDNNTRKSSAAISAKIAGPVWKAP